MCTCIITTAKKESKRLLVYSGIMLRFVTLEDYGSSGVIWEHSIEITLWKPFQYTVLCLLIPWNTNKPSKYSVLLSILTCKVKHSYENMVFKLYHVASYLFMWVSASSINKIRSQFTIILPKIKIQKIKRRNNLKKISNCFILKIKFIDTRRYSDTTSLWPNVS